ncbi:MAG TPA: hypothetical protein VN541_18065 [Tepidisphaeraceae bacterium]|nr:hypothetical protein [Tepidisphaeraceae bacterium]
MSMSARRCELMKCHDVGGTNPEYCRADDLPEHLSGAGKRTYQERPAVSSIEDTSALRAAISGYLTQIGIAAAAVHADS